MRHLILLLFTACGDEKEEVISLEESVQVQEDSGHTEVQEETNNTNEGQNFLGDLTINSEDTIKEFCSQYSTLHGSLTIYGSAITTLSDLQCLTKIYGSLTIYDTHIENLEGLHNLTYIGERLYLGYWQIGLTASNKVNPYLTDISALQNLTYLGERYIIVADENTKVICDSGIVDLLNIWQDHFVPPSYSYCQYDGSEGASEESADESASDHSEETSEETSEEEDVSNTPPVAVCHVNTSEVSPPFESATFDGSDSYSPSGSSITSYYWALTSAPMGSSVTLPYTDQATIPNVMPDLAGEYVAQLTVTDGNGITDTCDIGLQAVPDENLWIEMYWTQPGDDMDIHLIAPNYDWQEYWQSDWDCYFNNCVTNAWSPLDWGATGYIGDDPLLELDNINDVGPEVSNISEPESSGLYTVVVHDHPGSNYQMSNDVTVNIYLDGSLTWSDTRSISSEDTCTPFANIDWGSLAIVPINEGSVSCTATE